MTNFVDAIRSKPPSNRRVVTVLGVDPDIHTLGIASASARIGGSLPVEVLSVRLSSVCNRPPKKASQHTITEGMCKLLNANHLRTVAHLPNPDAVVVETQDFYPKRDMERPKMVSVANALISIATITGLAMGFALQTSQRARIVAPNVWKGNRDKPADHLRSQKIIGKAVVLLVSSETTSDIFTVHTQPLITLPAEYEHALDGLGMALYGVEQLHRGTWI